MEKWTRLLIILATSLLMFATLAVAVRLTMTIHHTLLLFALGGLVAYALNPLVDLLSKTRMKRQAGVGIVFVVLLALIGFGVYSLSGAMAAQVRDLPATKARALDFAASTDRILAARHVRFSLMRTIQHPPRSVQAAIKKAGTDAVPLLQRGASDVTESIIVLLIALYFLIYAADMRTKFNGMLPQRLQERADLWETDVNRILGGFVRGQFVIAFITGIAAAVVCLAIGIHLWLVIGLVVTVASLIPVFGPYLALVPAVLAALIGPTHFSPVVGAVAVILLFTAINEVSSKVLYPKLVGAALGLHEVLVLFVLFAGLEINGIVGVLFAAPVAAIAIVSVVHLYRFWQDLPDQLLSNTARRDARRSGQIAPPPKPAAPAASGR